jgi:hypothetical protein
VPPARQVGWGLVRHGGVRYDTVRQMWVGKIWRGRVRQLWMGKVLFGEVLCVLVGQLGWGTDGMDSVWSEVVWHGSHGVFGCGRVRYESAV